MYAIVDYTVVPTTGTNFADLMKDGWIPHGNITFNTANTSFQALMKYDTTLLNDAEDRARRAEKRLEESEDRAATAEAEVEELEARLETAEARLVELEEILAKQKVRACYPTVVEMILLIFMTILLQKVLEMDPTYLNRITDGLIPYY